MAVEVERKFLVRSADWRAQASPPQRLIQGYLPTAPGGGVTMRIRVAGEIGFITLKGRPTGVSRSEFEYEIPLADALAMLSEFCAARRVEKLRYLVPASGGLCWEVDEYLGRNSGLFTAEIELPAPDCPFERPGWLGREVSGDVRFTNGALSRCPWCAWPEKPPTE